MLKSSSRARQPGTKALQGFVGAPANRVAATVGKRNLRIRSEIVFFFSIQNIRVLETVQEMGDDNEDDDAKNTLKIHRWCLSRASSRSSNRS